MVDFYNPSVVTGSVLGSVQGYAFWSLYRPSLRSCQRCQGHGGFHHNGGLASCLIYLVRIQMVSYLVEYITDVVSGPCFIWALFDGCQGKDCPSNVQLSWCSGSCWIIKSRLPKSKMDQVNVRGLIAFAVKHVSPLRIPWTIKWLCSFPVLRVLQLNTIPHASPAPQGLNISSQYIQLRWMGC